jgi:hypothetical protein
VEQRPTTKRKKNYKSSECRNTESCVDDGFNDGGVVFGLEIISGRGNTTNGRTRVAAAISSRLVKLEFGTTSSSISDKPVDFTGRGERTRLGRL